MEIPLDMLSSVLSFAGGAVLTFDAFLKRHDVRVEEGAGLILDVLKKDGAGSLLQDRDGRPLDTLGKVKLRLAQRSQHSAWIGFALVTAGFLLEIVEAWSRGG